MGLHLRVWWCDYAKMYECNITSGQLPVTSNNILSKVLLFYICLSFLMYFTITLAVKAATLIPTFHSVILHRPIFGCHMNDEIIVYAVSMLDTIRRCTSVSMTY